MATNRKLGKTTDIRLAMLKTQVTDLLLHGQIQTTATRAKEVQSIAEKLIALAIREKDNFETVDAKVVKAKLDSNGNKVTELVKSKNGKEFLKVVKEETTEKRQKDMPSRLNALIIIKNLFWKEISKTDFFYLLILKKSIVIISIDYLKGSYTYEKNIKNKFSYCCVFSRFWNTKIIC